MPFLTRPTHPPLLFLSSLPLRRPCRAFLSATSSPPALRCMPSSPVFSQLVFMGCSSAVPVVPHRNFSSALLTLSTGRSILFDCGEATQHQIRLTKGTSLSRLDLILITHLHGDHCFGLPGLLCSMQMDGQTHRVTVVGPLGIKEYLETAFRLSHSTVENIDILELVPDTHQKVDLELPFLVEAYPLVHTVPTFGYRIQEHDRRGTFLVAKAKQLGITDPRLFGGLYRGEDLTLSNGTIITPDQVLSSPIKGRQLLFLQDTANSQSVLDDKSTMSCDLLIHDATYDNSMHSMAIERGHSTAGMAGQMAHSLDAKTLVLTHYSARYSTEQALEQLQHQAQEQCPSTKVYLARDFKRFEFTKTHIIEQN